MSKISKAALDKAHSPAARQKAVETRRRNQEEKLRLAGEQANTPMPNVPDGGMHMSIDDIPDRPVRKKYAKKQQVKVKFEQQFIVTEKEYVFLKMAKLLLLGEK